MKYTIEHETASVIRIRLLPARLGRRETEGLKKLLGNVPGVEGIRVFPETGGVSVTHCGTREAVTGWLDGTKREELYCLPLKEEGGSKALKAAKRAVAKSTVKKGKGSGSGLSAAQKHKMKTGVIAEAVADIFLPEPAQLAFHLFQLFRISAM